MTGVPVPLFCAPKISEKATSAFIVEGESDTMRLWQEFKAQGLPVNVYGLSGVNAWNKEHVDLVTDNGRINTVYVCLDNDTAYETRVSVDAQWNRIRSDIGAEKVRRVTLPLGIKDICDMFQTYDFTAFKKLVAESKRPTYQYATVDLTKTQQYKWLVDPLLAHNDVAVLYGDPGIGKSWLSMSLAVAIVEGKDTWLGMPIKPGRVLYVDEENSLDIVQHRMTQLGLTDKGSANLRYLWYSGVDVGKHPDKLYNDAEVWKPSLIVLDSLSRIHSMDENKTDVMNRIFNEGIIPLSRKLDSAVLILHHAPKPNMMGGKRSPRGSGVISAACDITLEVVEGTSTNKLVIVPNKLRRIPKVGSQLHVSIKDVGDMVEVGLNTVTDEF